MSDKKQNEKPLDVNYPPEGYDTKDEYDDAVEEEIHQLLADAQSKPMKQKVVRY